MQLAAILFTFTTAIILWLPAPALADSGHCSFVQQGRSQSHQVCEMPVDNAACTAVGQAEGHSEAAYAPGACPVAGLVGTCDKGATKLVYYEGDPAQLEIGCGFQGGTWVNP